MEVWRVIGFLAVYCSVVVNSRVNIDTALRLAHCRATCVHKMNLTIRSSESCRATHDCSECWNTCRIILIRPQVCERKDCRRSCRESCRWLSSGSPRPTLLNRSLDELDITGPTVSWPPVPFTAPSTLYVVMVDHQQYTQTFDLSATLPPAVDLLTVQVLVVDWRGLSQIFTSKPQSPLEVARTLLDQLGLDKAMGLHYDIPVRNPTVFSNLDLFKDRDIPWGLREVTKTFEEDIARVEISWKPQQLSTVTYLVTWQVEGGLIRGNLLTNSSRTTLSLGSNTTFRIKVTMFTLDSPTRSSDVLVVETQRPPEDQRQPNIGMELTRLALRFTRGFVIEMLVAGATVAVMVAVLALIWRCQNWCSGSHAIYLDVNHVFLYRDIYPNITLTSEEFYNTNKYSMTQL